MNVNTNSINHLNDMFGPQRGDTPRPGNFGNQAVNYWGHNSRYGPQCLKCDTRRSNMVASSLGAGIWAPSRLGTGMLGAGIVGAGALGAGMLGFGFTGGMLGPMLGIGLAGGALGLAARLGLAYGAYRTLDNRCNHSLQQMYAGPRCGAWPMLQAPTQYGGQPAQTLSGWAQHQMNNFPHYDPPPPRPQRGDGLAWSTADGKYWDVNHDRAMTTWWDKDKIWCVNHIYPTAKEPEKIWRGIENRTTGEICIRRSWISHDLGDDDRITLVANRYHDATMESRDTRTPR